MPNRYQQDERKNVRELFIFLYPVTIFEYAGILPFFLRQATGSERSAVTPQIRHGFLQW